MSLRRLKLSIYEVVTLREEGEEVLFHSLTSALDREELALHLSRFNAGGKTSVPKESKAGWTPVLDVLENVFCLC
jgi:hypothetical protein